jgi:hypothetical protein
MRGIAINEHIVPKPDPADPAKVIFDPIISVLWDDQRTPAPSYHSPSDLVWELCPGDDALQDGDEDEDDDEESDGEEEGEETA